MNVELKDINKIMFRRKHNIILPTSTLVDTYRKMADENIDYVRQNISRKIAENTPYVMAMEKNYETLGYTMSGELYNNICLCPLDTIVKINSELVELITEETASDVEYYPMYPNFPQQVMEASEAELYVNAIIHYLTLGEWKPGYEKQQRLPFADIEDKDYTLIGTCDIKDVDKVFANLLQSKTNLSNMDKQDLITIFHRTPYFNPCEYNITLKENVAILLGEYIKNSEDGYWATIKLANTATDVLRAITYISDGDISLADDTRYCKLRRPQRRLIMDMLAYCKNINEDMWRYREKWLRIGEIIHPFDEVFRKPKYDRVRAAFNNIRNEKKPLYFNGKVEHFIQMKDFVTASNLLKQRPGEFARRLDKMLRDSEFVNMREKIIKDFEDVSMDIAPTVLLQVRKHFLCRHKSDARFCIPKGANARAIKLNDDVKSIDKQICKRIANICETSIIRQYMKKDKLGKVYIGEEMHDFIIPFSQRNASDGTKNVTRGSRISFNHDIKYIRPFIWWTNTDWRIDVDLSALFLNRDMKVVDHISYTRLQNEYGCHSGDIIDGGNPNGDGAAEFIDIDIDKCNDAGVRYVLFQVYNYTGINYAEMPNCRFGFMERAEIKSGEIFEPKTVQMKIDLNSPSPRICPMILDVNNRQFIWIDMNFGGANSEYRCYRNNNVETHKNALVELMEYALDMHKTTMYELITLNVIARGINVTDRNKADIIFSLDTTPPLIEDRYFEEDGTLKTRWIEKENYQIVTPYDLDYFMAEML